MVARLLASFALLCALGLAAGCASSLPPPTYASSLPPPTYAIESPGGSDAWTEVDALPAWVDDGPTPREGTLFFVTTAKSDLRRLAVQRASANVVRTAREDVHATLRWRWGDSVASGASKRVGGALVMVESACRTQVHEVSETHALIGSTVRTAWVLWELPLDAVVAGLPEDLRDEARELLSD